MAERTLKISYTGDPRGALGALKQIEDAHANFGDKMRLVGQKISSVGRGLTLGLTLPLVAAGKVAVDAASNLNESINKTNEVFGRNAQEILKWSKASSTSFGLAQQDALDAAANFGLFADAAGQSGEAATGFAKDMVALSSDLASFFNVPVAQALEDIRSGLAGQSEPMRKYGVFLTENAVVAEAMRIGLVGANEELTEGEKVLARQSLILQQTGKAQGDFARTSDGLANTQRIVAAQLKDTAAAFGEILLPVVSKAMTFFQGLLNSLNSLNPAQRELIVQVAAVAAAAGPVLLIVGKLVSAVGVLASVFGVFAAPVALVIGALVALGAAFASTKQGQQALRGIVAEVWPTIQKIISQVVEAVKGVIQAFVQTASAVWRRWGDEIMAFTKSFMRFVGDAIVEGLKIVRDIFRAVTAAVNGDWGKFWHLIDNAADRGGELVARAFEVMGDAIQNIMEWIGDRIVDLMQLAMRKLWEAVKAGAGAVMRFFAGLPGDILSALGNLGSLLYNAGREVLTGFWNGLKSVWDDVTGFVSGIGGWIADHKGPIEKDRKLLVDHGKAIMGGFESGLRDGMRGVEGFVGSVAPSLGGIGVGGGGVTLNVSVGTVVGPGGIRDVAEQIRNELVRTGYRNPDIFGGRA